jgi:hypothetical protein
MPVSGTVTVGLSLTNTSTTNTLGQGRDVISEGSSPISVTDGNGTNQYAKMASGRLTLAISTPQEIDLTAVASALGSVNFATVKLFYVYNEDTTAGREVTIGGGATNPWIAPFGGTTPTVKAQASSPLVLARQLGTGWTVSGAAKTVKFDPGANAQNVRFVICGT